MTLLIVPSIAASEKDGRAILTGVNLTASQGKMQCVATDSYRIARKVLKIKGKVNFIDLFDGINLKINPK